MSDIFTEDSTREPTKNAQAPNKATDAECFTVSFGGQDLSQDLQSAFLQFRKQKQQEVKQAQKLRQIEISNRSDTASMLNLRRKFLLQAKKYFGIPYAKRYWQPEEDEHHFPLFLDCCGLVRQVLRDLQQDFGFRIGPWNQSYMYDTLPITLEGPEQMKPGDLVFIAASYCNSKAKVQRHSIVHVEIWAGEGASTIGARWQRGKVQVFDNYAFEAKSYHSPTYIFKSIETWLQGTCRSHCPEHSWKTLASTMPGERSIFYVQQDEENQFIDAESVEQD